MIQQKVFSSQLIPRSTLLGLIFAASAFALQAQILPLPHDVTVFLPPQDVSTPPGSPPSNPHTAWGQQIVVDSNGDINIVWLDNSPGYYAVFFSRSSDSGLTFSAPLNLSHDPGEAWSPRIAVDSAGNINVVWWIQNGAQSGFFSRSTDGGTTFSTPLSISNYLTFSPQIALDSSGNIYLGWVDASSKSHDLFFSRSNDGGSTFSTPVQVTNRPPVGNASVPLIAVDTAGNINLLWNDCFSDCITKFSRSSDGGASFSPQKNIVNNFEYFSPLGLTLDSAGNIYVVFNTFPFGNVWLALSMDGGVTFSETNISNLAFRHQAGHAQVAIDSSSNVDVVWKDDNPGNIFFSRSNDYGATFSATSVTNTGSDPQIAVDAGGIDLVWMDGPQGSSDILFSRSSDGGATFSAPQNISNDGKATTPLIAVDPGGGINVTWMDNSTGNFDIFFSHGITQKVSLLDHVSALRVATHNRWTAKPGSYFLKMHEVQRSRPLLLK